MVEPAILVKKFVTDDMKAGGTQFPVATGAATQDLSLTAPGTAAWGGAQSGLQASGVLSTSNLLNCFTTPVPLIPAPPAGSVIVVEMAVVQLLNGSAPFAAGGAIYLQYGTANTSLATATNILANGGDVTGTAANTNYIWSAAGSMTANITVNTIDPQTVPSASIVAQPLCLSNRTANFTTGNGTMKWWVKYSIVSGLS